MRTVTPVRFSGFLGVLGCLWVFGLGWRSVAATHAEVLPLNDNGAWSWFMDERAVLDDPWLIVGSVRATGRFETSASRGWGNVEIAARQLSTGETRTVVLHEHFEQDDHDSPALLVLPDGRYLAAWTKHGQETKVYTRVSSRPHDPRQWEPVRTFVTPGVAGPFRGDSVTYANLFRLSADPPGRVHLLHRGVGLDPNHLVSDDNGGTWRYAGRLFRGRDGYSPYVKYASNGKDTIHFVATEDHPRNFDNSLYHGYLRDGRLFRSDGAEVGRASSTTNTAFNAWDFTRVFTGHATNVAWMCDLHLDDAGNPVVLFTTQRDGAGLPMGAGGLDHRLHYARWEGTRWHSEEIAYAGTRLYPGEDDYTGLGALDPARLDVVYLSTDAHPVTGLPLISRTNFRRHHELFRGVRSPTTAQWSWTAVTTNSTTDNLRPLVPMGREAQGRTALVWMRGSYRVNRGEWTTEVVASLLPEAGFP